MQQAIGETVSAISDVAGRVEMVNETIGAIAAAVVEQDAVTRDIAQSVSQTADSVRLVHERIRGSVATQAGVTTKVFDPASPQHVRAGRAGRQYREAGDRQPAEFPLRGAAPGRPELPLICGWSASWAGPGTLRSSRTFPTAAPRCGWIRGRCRWARVALNSPEIGTIDAEVAEFGRGGDRLFP